MKPGMARGWRRHAIRLVAILAAAYAALVLVMYLYQGALLYPAIAQRPAPPGFEVVTLRTVDGLDLQAGYRPPEPGMPTLVFFHGNAMVWPQSTCCTSEANAAGYGLLLAEYRGYNGNSGKPTEEGLYADGRAALAWLAERGTAMEDTVIVGYSLGSGVAMQMATEMRPRALILISAYARMAEVASGKYPFVPVDWLLEDRFDNVEKIADVAAPVLLIHGEADTLIPLSHAHSLSKAAPSARLFVLPGAGHIDTADSSIAQAWQLEFLGAIAAPHGASRP